MTTPDWIATGKCQTKGNHKVRIYATDGCALTPIHGAIRINSGWHNWEWDIRGRSYGCSRESEHDLIPIPQVTREMWRLPDDVTSACTSLRHVPVNVTRDPDGKVIKVELAE